MTFLLPRRLPADAVTRVAQAIWLAEVSGRRLPGPWGDDTFPGEIPTYENMARAAIRAAKETAQWP